MTENLGKTLRGYRLVERVGVGATGAVYRAQPLMGGEDVAIKLIQPAFANRPDYVRRFESEAQLSARLSHPNILPLMDYWRDAEGAYLIMRLLPGTLRGEIGRYPNGLPLERALRLLQQIAGALAQAHGLGIVHCDVKPSNILLDDRGTPYLADFGVAQAAAEAIKASEIPLGSPLYAAPEQIQGRALTPQSDQYSLAIMLYEMLTGQPPFQADDAAALLTLHVQEPLPPLGARAPWLPVALDLVLARAAAKDPGRRYASVEEFAADFARVAHSVQESPLTGMLGVEQPYPGLRPFNRAQAPFYFGREAIVEQALKRMQPGPLASLALLSGPRGGGASSLLEAGIVPALAQGRVAGAARWHLRRWQPPEAEALAGLAAVLASLPGAPEAEEIAQGLVQKQAHLGEMVERWLPLEDGLALLIDDLTPLLRAVNDAEAQRVLLLLRAGGASRLRVVAVLPAEYIGQALASTALAPALREALVLLPALTPEEIERAVTGPAKRLGVEVERDFVAAVQAAMRGVPDPLPRMQFALAAAFAVREGPQLNLGHLLRVGGLEHAIERAAEAAYARLTPAEQRALPLLVRAFFGADGCTRRLDPASLAALEAQQPGVAGAAEAMLNLGLMREEGGLLQCASPAVLRAWPRLAGWHDEAIHREIYALRQRERTQTRRASIYAGMFFFTVLALVVAVLLLGAARRGDGRNAVAAQTEGLLTVRDPLSESARLAEAATQAQAVGRRGLALALAFTALDYSPAAEEAYDVTARLLGLERELTPDARRWQAALQAAAEYRALNCEERLFYRVMPLCGPGGASP